MLNYEQPPKQSEYSTLGFSGPAKDSATATTTATATATSKPAGEYDTLTGGVRVDRELLEAAALYESTKINIDEIETKEQGEDLIRRHLKLLKH